MAIQDYKVSENYTGRDISSLSDRPNEDGLTAQQLKARFDQLNKEVIPNYNDLIDALDVILTNDSEDISALYALVEDHEGRLSIVEATLPNKSDIGHNHDERYYTESESDALLSGKSNVGHTHDDRYYTESEIDSKFSANSLADRARANHTGTQSADTLVDGTTNKAFLSTERTKLAGIESGAEVNQNAFSNIQVGATQIQADQKTDTFTLIAGANISLTPNATNDSITISATGELAVQADNVDVVDIGDYFLGNNVEDILQEVGLSLQNISSDAEDVSITDSGDYFVSDNVEGALQEVGSDLLEKMNLDGSNSLVEDLTFVGNGVLSYDGDRQILQYTNTDGTTNDVGAEVWFSEGKASGAIANGAPVQFAGVQGDHYLFKTAVPSEINANPSLFMGIATSDIANNAWGKVTNFGVVHDINTNGWTMGTILWFDSVNGGLTSTKPSYPNAQIQVCAVIVQNSTVGSIIVRPTVYQDAYTRSETDTKLDTKAPINNPTFTGNVSGITKAMVGLGNVDNTSDVNKPISTATQTALDGKLSLTGGTLTGALNGTSATFSGNIYPQHVIPAYDKWYYSQASSSSNQLRMNASILNRWDMYNQTANAHANVAMGNLELYGGQIKFPATQNPSADPNTLDDYEEGTFTPTLLGSSSNPTVNYSTDNTGGRYIKIGKMVFVSLEVRWSSLSGGSGAVFIGNLPFMRVSTLHPDGDKCVVQSYNNSYSGNTLTGNIVSSTNYSYIESNLSGGTTQTMPISGLTTGFGFIRFSGTYEATA